jgi:hypothetical protein
MPLLASLIIAASTAHAPAIAECGPIPGWNQVLADKRVRWIVIGELHGTSETPAIFADAVCLTAANRGPVVVGLEIPTGDQPAIDAFMASDGGPEAQTEFLRALIWHMPKDGRSSEAFFRLFESLRRLHAQGHVTRVVAFQDSTPYDRSAGQAPYEEKLAAIVRDAATPGATVIALVGNLHARKTEVDFGKPFMPMASRLPADRTLTLDAVGNGGTAWNCTGPTPPDCGPHPNRANAPAERGVELKPVEDGAYDGRLNLGTETTASPPQRVP